MTEPVGVTLAVAAFAAVRFPRRIRCSTSARCARARHRRDHACPGPSRRVNVLQGNPLLPRRAQDALAEVVRLRIDAFALAAWVLLLLLAVGLRYGDHLLS